jgi:hypothetical protein
MTKPTRVIPAKAGIQLWGHDEVGAQAASRRKRSQAGKSWRTVIFWMLAFATIAMTPRRISQSYRGLC